MTGTTITLHTAAVEALVAQLPTPTPLRAVAVDPASAHGLRLAGSSVVVTSFVGSVSADTAVVLADMDQLAAAAGTDNPMVSVSDVLRPALEAATGVLGTGVLGESRRESADALLADPETVVFELTAAGQPAGWFALRLRETGTIGGSSPVVPASSGVSTGNLGRINNVEMALTVEIGRTRMSVRDVLGLEPGAVIELDRSAGAPADVLLNGRLIAHGEVVVVDQDYAVRITKILDVADGIA
ncbi:MULTISPECIES: flagellar motor switch protein FliN [unclassified Frigoribacterium]|uniref:flagellar motor switch protein FliN n=1 Tax=unclassified Frigoribacterium TaxID=2627005 RepID=UPI0005B9110B|nr:MULTISPECIES: flagellar motor switch protein FliN [unclassified Frigoribacterium]KIU02510.1 flagellar motor switch protein FliN [Frigoribacterium sp. MEB024]MBD8537867.1 flagellar motor switch protein FliN [Frigoribacterium sp. CFBP 8751]